MLVTKQRWHPSPLRFLLCSDREGDIDESWKCQVTLAAGWSSGNAQGCVFALCRVKFYCRWRRHRDIVGLIWVVADKNN